MQEKTLSSTSMAQESVESAAIDEQGSVDETISLNRETEAVKLLISQLRIIEDQTGDDLVDDEEFFSEVVAGQTNLLEAIDVVIERIHIDNALIEGMKEAEARIEARRKRFTERNERRSFAVANALQLAKRDRHETPLVTISRRKAPPRSEVVAEHELPAKYWKLKDPEVDKRLLLADLKAADLAGEKISGAILIKGEQVTAWRWS